MSESSPDQTPEGPSDEDGTAKPRRSKRRILGLSGLGLLVLFGVIQLVPYGRDHTNPPVKTEPAWTTAEVEALATASCGDCHSNITEWPWYTNVAPVSWLAQRDVDEGRSVMNWSEGCAEVAEITEVIESGEMPPWQYTIKHRDAVLSAAEKKVLATGLAASIRDAPGVWRECGGD